MKSCGFCQNSIGNPLWANNSNIFPPASNMIGGFGMLRSNNPSNMNHPNNYNIGLSPQ